MLDLQSLPSDAEKLKEIIVTQFLSHQKEIKLREEKLQIQENKIKKRDKWIDQLTEALRLARMARFACTSEKLPSNQSELFNEVELVAKEEAAEGVEVDEELSEVNSEVSDSLPRKVRPKRKALPAHLVREEVILDLSDTEKVCEKDGSALKEIASEISEQLDYVPAQMKVIRWIRKKYVCPCCDETIKTASLPEKILPKSNAAPGLLAYIATSKYVDALPLYRLNQMFKRMDVDLPRNTMASWMIALREKLQPLYNLMEEDLLSSDYVCADETVVQVLKEEGKKAESKSYMWVRARPGENPIILFDYDPTRSGEVPKRLLKDFKGYLQVDGYAGYDGVCSNPEITRVGCMAHVRRKFFDSYKVNKKVGGPAEYVLGQIKLLYKIEEAIKEKKVEEKKRMREEEALPILSALKQWIDENESKYPPQSLIGKALTYAKNQWKHLLQYTREGKLNIDNNFTENRIRPFAVGRKNWLFSDSVEGAEASGMIYSILQTARGNGLEPYAYLKHLLTELPKAKTLEKIEKLLPHKIDFKILN